MLPQVLLLLVAHISTFVFAKDTPLSFTRIRRASQRNVPPEGFYDPRTNGGTWLTVRQFLHEKVIMTDGLLT
jgi:hypothetical protein